MSERPPDRPLGRPPRPAAGQAPEPISIWQPRQRDGALRFERPPPGPFGDHYSNRPTFFHAKAPGSRRICFFGESAAAGYLYAPHLTPARVLEKQLDAASGSSDSYEVIDLARTNERLATLVETVRQSLQLTPDLIVVYAGNNWTLLETPEASPHYPSTEARIEVAGALSRGGLRGAAELSARRSLERGAAALRRIAELAGAAGVPVVAVVPEVNLADWETAQPPPWLAGDRSSRWHAHYGDARQHLLGEDWRELEKEARALLALDRQAGPGAHRLLARALLGREDVDGAAAACREEIAAVHYATLGPLAAPQASPMVQEMIRRAARHHGFGCVDLPAVFGDHLGSTLPGRELFLDYCHLTARGMHVAGAAIAAAALRRFEGAAIGWRQVLDRSPRLTPAPEAAASTFLGAAIHTAHRLHAVGPKGPLLEHWCRRALATAPGARGALADFITARCAETPAVLSAALARIQESPYRMTLQHGWRWDHLDLDMILAAATVLDEATVVDAARAPWAERTNGLLAARAPTPERPLELAAAPYLWEPIAQLFPEAMASPAKPRHAFYRSIWPQCDFALPATGHRALTLDLVARSAQGAPGDARISVRVNGALVADLPATPTWRRHRIALPTATLKRGANRVTLGWPELTGTGEDALARAIARLERGRPADLHPIFGEVHSLRARIA